MLLEKAPAILAFAEAAGFHMQRHRGPKFWHFPVGILGTVILIGVVGFLFIWILAKLVDQKKPQAHDNPFYRAVMTFYIAVVKTVLRVRVHTKGLEQTPKKGRMLLVCNHLSNADPVILLHYFRKCQLAFISKRENSTMFIVGPLMHKIMCQPINRENDREALKTILTCIRLIKEDEVSIGVFPEGYIKGDGKLHHFRPGVFKIAQKTNVPIVVCTLKNTAEIFDNLPHWKLTDVELHLVKTITPEEYEGMSTVEISNMVYQLMAEDLGPELVAQE